MEAGAKTSNGRDGELSLEAIRIATDAARAAERSAASALATMERAEGSLKMSEERMGEVSAAAVAAAGEATEARLRATEIATEFRALEEKVSGAIRATRTVRKRTEPSPLIQEAPRSAAPAASEAKPTVAARPVTPARGGTTAEFEALWESFDSKADRIVERLKALEARTMTVIRTPPHRSGGIGHPGVSRSSGSTG